jgi:hypothetical protein
MRSRKNILPFHQSREIDKISSRSRIKKIIDHVSRLSKISPSRKKYRGPITLQAKNIGGPQTSNDNSG